MIYHENVCYKYDKLAAGSDYPYSELKNRFTGKEAQLIPKDVTFCPLTIVTSAAEILMCGFYNYDEPDDFYETYYDDCEDYAKAGIRTNNETCFGDYPSSYKNETNIIFHSDDVLLFHTFDPDTHKEIHFFIKENDLKNRRFDKTKMSQD